MFILKKSWQLKRVRRKNIPADDSSWQRLQLFYWAEIRSNNYCQTCTNEPTFRLHRAILAYALTFIHRVTEHHPSNVFLIQAIRSNNDDHGWKDEGNVFNRYRKWPSNWRRPLSQWKHYRCFRRTSWKEVVFKSMHFCSFIVTISHIMEDTKITRIELSVIYTHADLVLKSLCER